MCVRVNIQPVEETTATLSQNIFRRRWEDLPCMNSRIGIEPVKSSRINHIIHVVSRILGWEVWGFNSLDCVLTFVCLDSDDLGMNVPLNTTDHELIQHGNNAHTIPFHGNSLPHSVSRPSLLPQRTNPSAASGLSHGLDEVACICNSSHRYHLNCSTLV